MRTSQCAVYQVKETPEYRDVRFRSYEKLRSEGKRVSIENYQQVYIGRIQPGETPADIKMRLQKQRPKNFKGHSIGCSDVLVITDEGKTTAYYINKDGFIIVPEFLTIKSSSDTRLSIDTTAYKYITETSRKKEYHFVLWIVFAITASFLYNERRTEKICTAVVERVSGKGKSTGAGK